MTAFQFAWELCSHYNLLFSSITENNSASSSTRSSSIDLPTLQLLTTTGFPFVESTTHAGIPIIIVSVLVVEGSYETLSTNRNSVEHMYSSTEHESTEPDLSQYQSLTNPPESDIHTYASTEPKLSQYQSLTNPPESDINTNASTEQDLSQYQSLTNPPESDIHTYASTASVQLRLINVEKNCYIKKESTTIVHIVPGDEVLLNCSESLSITIGKVSVQNIGKCKSNKNDCNLNRNDHELINGCESSSSCNVDGSFLTSACLWEDLHFDLSYICKASYEYVGCYVDNWFRVLDEGHYDKTETSADICFDICTDSHTSYTHEYFGTQNGHECFCGDGQGLNSHPYYKRRESECNTQCLENTDEMCGGSFRMSVYKITTQKKLITHSCLKVNQTSIIQDCKPNQIQEDSLCIKFDVFSTDNAIDESCRDQDKEIENKLYQFCKNTKLNCVYNLARFLPAEIELQPPTKYISIVYSCKGKASTTSSTLSSSVTASSTQSNSITASSTQSNSLKVISTLSNSVTTSSTLSSDVILSTRTVVGIVVGSVLFISIVFISICIGRRFVFCAKSKKKFRNTPETNDYIGNQNIALPQAVSSTCHMQYEDLHTQSGNKSTPNYSNTTIHSQNIDDKYNYAKNIETNNSKTFNDKTITPTYVVLHDDSYKPNPEANNDEYAVVDPTTESSFKQTPKTTTQGPENYMILDPDQTGFYRSKFPNADQAYVLAKPIHDSKDQKNDLYALSPAGTYDHSGITRHHKDQDTIYTHTVDNVYDSASRGLNMDRTEDTYDHFFGQETEDEYNISMHT
ncbi:unnamed protein product [Mytilus coruscus]|uniref:WSC domain-containing protein n=1 Tax=Mytilus coruscus TaxID=42192 RepID=A0A6J8D5S6_MYTCO|nr:unnamed protein product [Mytilus coruscus]